MVAERDHHTVDGVQSRVDLGAGDLAKAREFYGGLFGWNTPGRRGKDFYKAVFEWDAESQGPEGPGGYTEWKVGGRSIGGMMAGRPPCRPTRRPVWGVTSPWPTRMRLSSRLKSLEPRC
jgi:predicted enzyme related to lactoylglutathione lyase